MKQIELQISCKNTLSKATKTKTQPHFDRLDVAIRKTLFAPKQQVNVKDTLKISYKAII